MPAATRIVRDALREHLARSVSPQHDESAASP